MKAMLIALACTALVAGCSTQSANGGASGTVGGGSSVGQGTIGSTSSSSMLMQQIKQGDSTGR